MRCKRCRLDIRENNFDLIKRLSEDHRLDRRFAKRCYRVYGGMMCEHFYIFKGDEKYCIYCRVRFKTRKHLKQNKKRPKQSKRYWSNWYSRNGERKKAARMEYYYRVEVLK